MQGYNMDYMGQYVMQILVVAFGIVVMLALKAFHKGRKITITNSKAYADASICEHVSQSNAFTDELVINGIDPDIKKKRELESIASAKGIIKASDISKVKFARYPDSVTIFGRGIVDKAISFDRSSFVPLFYMLNFKLRVRI